MPGRTPPTMEHDPRFAPRDHAALHVFDNEPGNDIKTEFLDYVRSNGTPDFYRWHVHAQSSRRTTPKIVTAFGIPEDLREKDGIGPAPCPLCSLNKGRYHSGYLVYFSEERCLRAICPECGHGWLEGGGFAAEDKRDHAQRLNDIAVARLIDGLPLVPSLRRFIATMAPKARLADDLGRRIRESLSKANRARLLGLTRADGMLRTLRLETQPVTDRYGALQTGDDGRVRRRDVEVVATAFELLGEAVLMDDHDRAEVALYDAENHLAGLDAVGDDRIRACIARWSPEARLDAARRLAAARASIQEALGLCNEIHAFVRRSNLEALFTWAVDERSPLPLGGRYIDAAYFYLGDGKGSLNKIETYPDASLLYAAPQWLADWTAVPL